MARARITEEEVERHLDSLEEIGPKLATAKAESDFHSDFIKTVYAAEYMKSDAPRAADREAEALSSEAYFKALKDKRLAMIEAEKLRHQKAFHERAIEVWQTMSANNRGRV